MSEEKLVLCMKWGEMYVPEYVNVLYEQVFRNPSYPSNWVSQHWRA